MEEALDSTDDSPNIFMLEMIVLPLGSLIWTFFKMTLDLGDLAIAEKEEKMFKFAVFLLDATIQDNSMKEGSNDII